MKQRLAFCIIKGRGIKNLLRDTPINNSHPVAPPQAIYERVRLCFVLVISELKSFAGNFRNNCQFQIKISCRNELLLKSSALETNISNRNHTALIGPLRLSAK